MYSALSLLLAASSAVWAAPTPGGVCALLPNGGPFGGCSTPPPVSSPPPQYNSYTDMYIEKLPSTCFNIQSALTGPGGTPMYLTVDVVNTQQVGFTTIAAPLPNWVNYTMHTMNGQSVPVGSTQKFCARNQGPQGKDSSLQIASVIVNGAMEVGGLSELGYMAYATNSQTVSNNPFATYPLPGGPNTTDLWYTMSYTTQAKGWFSIVALNWPGLEKSEAVAYLDVNMAQAGQARQESQITLTGDVPGRSMTWTVNTIPGNIDTSTYYW